MCQSGIELCFFHLSTRILPITRRTRQQETLASRERAMDPSYLSTSTVAVFCLEAILGAFLNTLTIMSVLRFDRLWSPPNILIISLSIGDCLPLIARVFTILDVVLVDIDREGWRIVCYLQTFFTSVSHGLNVHTIAAIAIERAVSVVHPIWSRNNVTIKSTQTAAVVIWLFVVTKKILEIVFGNKTTDELNGDCSWVVVLTRKTILYSVQPEFVLASVVTLNVRDYHLEGQEVEDQSHLVVSR